MVFQCAIEGTLALALTIMPAAAHGVEAESISPGDSATAQPPPRSNKLRLATAKSEECWLRSVLLRKLIARTFRRAAYGRLNTMTNGRFQESQFHRGSKKCPAPNWETTKQKAGYTQATRCNWRRWRAIIKWLSILESEEVKSFREIAERENIDNS